MSLDLEKSNGENLALYWSKDKMVNFLLGDKSSKKMREREYYIPVIASAREPNMTFVIKRLTI